MSLVRIQQHDSSGFWENIKVSSITTSDDEIVVVGRTFRILVDDEEVYLKGGRK